MACWARTHHSRQPCVTNVVKLEHFETPFNGPCYKRRQSEPKNQYFQRKSRRIDDVCNKTRRATDQRPSPTGVEGAEAIGGPGRGAGGRRQGQGGPRDRPLRAAGSRVAISRAGRRPPAHTAARPHSRGLRRPEHQRGHTAAPRSTTRRRVGRLTAPHPSTPVIQPAITPSPEPPRG